MITKHQMQHLSKLIEAYSEAREYKYWQDDQGWISAEIEKATADTDAAKSKLDLYLKRITEE